MLDIRPYVNLHLKEQVLKDKSIYTQKLCGARLFCAYYYNKLKKRTSNLTGLIWILALNMSTNWASHGMSV